MALTAIAYSIATGRVRWFLEGTDAEVNSVKPGPGEAVLVVDRKSASDLIVIQQLITSKTGKIPTNDRYAIVPLGIGPVSVTGALYADPTCGDSIPGVDMILHPTADAGWTYDRTLLSFSAPVTSVVAKL